MIRMWDLQSTLSLLALRRWPRREEILAFQDARLRRLVAHAHERVPYYRELFRAHSMEPRDIRSVADLHRIPLTSKADLQGRSPVDLVARGVDPARLIAHSTSGSTGEPATIRRTWIEERVAGAFRLRTLRDLGLRPSDRRAVIHIAEPHHPRNWQLPQRLVRAIGLYRRNRINCRLALEAILARLRELDPDVVSGYPGVLSRLAGMLEGEDRERIRPRLIVAGGEVLTPFMRRQIAEGFRARVVEVYSSYEFPLIAWQCPRMETLHTADDALILEVLVDGRPARPGEVGEVVATQLHSFAMPFLRYRIGDLVTRGETPCPCGAPFSTVRSVQGRLMDYFLLPRGRVMHPYELGVPVLDLAAPWTRQYQITQEREDRIVLTVVPLRQPSQEELDAVKSLMRSKVGPGVETDVVLAPSIATESSGKFRLYRSLVPSPLDAR